MAKGIVVKIWNVTAGSGKRSASSQIADSIAYIENPEKTGVPLDITNANQLSNELTYVTNEIKTASGLYVGGRHITDISHSVEEMMQVKDFFGKLDGRVATHGVISLDESESDSKNAGKLMELLNDVMEEVFPNHQVVYAVHTNTENLHIHFILNTVGLDGKKIHMDKQFMSSVLEPAVNKAAVRYGFTPNAIWEKEKKEDPLSLPQRKMMLRQAIDIAIEQTDEFDSVVAFLRNQGFIVNVGKNLSLQTDDMPKAMRSGQLGEQYSISAIRKRLDEKYNPFKEVKAGDYYASILPEEMANITPLKMKSYKDMSKEEKYEAVRLLRLGRNPWNEGRNTNWQMANMADELKNVNYVYKLVNHYSNGSLKVSDAMGKIIESRKAIADEKKELRVMIRAYKPITNIYQEMKQYMVRAYLFDAYGYSEYLSDYKKYQELSNRLSLGYGKSVEEVADLVFELNSKMAYLKAQDKELSAQYLAIKKFKENGKLQQATDDYSFFNAIGHSKAVYDAKHFGIYASEMKIITPADGDITIRVITRPGLVDGKPTEISIVSVIDGDGNTVKEASSEGMSDKAFNKEIYKIQTEYGIRQCAVERKNISGNARHI
ncbi:MAG: hypothetical protein E7222_10615 [Clostridiales bacterium]|nr:hypothetical protein [Clostridiales bacterium]